MVSSASSSPSVVEPSFIQTLESKLNASTVATGTSTSSDSAENLDTFWTVKVPKAINLLDGVFRTFGTGSIMVSFNGGKEATVILYLTLITLVQHVRKMGKDSKSENPKIPLIFFRAEDEFPQILEFIELCKKNYADWVDLREYSGHWLEVIQRACTDANPESTCTSTVNTTSQNLKTQKSPLVFVMGIRRTDPDGGKDVESLMASDSFIKANFLRCNPLLDWSYADIWRFLREAGLPYCELYDQGYTSLGTPKDTVRNPELRVVDSGGAGEGESDDSVKFLPAYELKDATSERAGRKKKGN